MHKSQDIITEQLQDSIQQFNRTKYMLNDEYLKIKQNEIELLHNKLTQPLHIYFYVINFLHIHYDEYKISNRKLTTVDISIFNDIYNIYVDYNSQLSFEDYMKLQAEFFLKNRKIRQLKYAIKQNKLFNIPKNEINDILADYLNRHLYVENAIVDDMVNRSKGRPKSVVIAKDKTHIINKKYFNTMEKMELYSRYKNDDIMVKLAYQKNPFLQKIIDSIELQNNFT